MTTALLARARSLRTPCALLVALTMITGLATEALAKPPSQVFKGQIIVSAKTFPFRFKSDDHFVAHMKKVDTKTLAANEDGTWSFEYMAFLKEPVGSLQASVTFYDVTVAGKEKLVTTFTFYPQNAKDVTVNGQALLEKDQGFEPDRKYKMTFSRGFGQKPLAQTFVTLTAKKSE